MLYTNCKLALIVSLRALTFSSFLNVHFRDALQILAPRLVVGTVIVFDELINYQVIVLSSSNFPKIQQLSH
jgi:hypothetical protein